MRNETCDQEDEDILAAAGSPTAGTAPFLMPPGYADQKLLYIMTLGVVGRYRHSGIATSLVERLISTVSILQSFEVVFLHVLHTNTAALGFYRKLGFDIHKLLTGYYEIKGVHQDAYSCVKYTAPEASPFCFGTFKEFLTNLKRIFFW